MDERKFLMDEQRCFERLDLVLRSRITVQGRNGNVEKGPMELTTENISSGGAFFCTDRPLSEGTKVVMEIVLPLERLKKAKGTHAHVNVKGRVLRAGPEGMAIQFDNQFSILPVAQGVSPSSAAVSFANDE
jgi:hypothetical protein